MGLTSDKGKYFVIFGIILLIFSLTGVIFVSIEKNEYLYHETRNGTRIIECSLHLEGNHSYEIIFGASDDSSGSDAVVRVPFVLYVDDTEVLNSRLYARDSFEYEDNENPETYDSIHYYLTLPDDVNLTLVGEMSSGDSWYFKIYQDVPPSIDTKFMICGIVIVFGVVALLMGAYEEMYATDEEPRRLDSSRRELSVFQKLSEWKEIDDEFYEENSSEKEDNYW